ncbi:MAG: VOC family protein [Hyphomicrobiaceae bacterium]|nr:VOC family protein [Hyphomicrobiaceae bacterium]
MTRHGHIHWIEIDSRDPAAAKAFYGAALGWTFTDMVQPDGSVYSLCMQDGEPVAGLFDLNTMSLFDGIPSHWFTFIAVDDVDVRVEKAVAAGAKIRREPWDIPGFGRCAVLCPPDGSVFGIIKPAAQD